MNARTLALIAAAIVSIIYGINYTVAKDVMPVYVKPFGFIFLRVAGGTLVFWVLGLFVKSEKIDRKDFKTMAIAAFFGVSLNLLTFFKGLSLTTPINASVIAVISPIMVLIFSSILLKEKLYARKILGVIIGLIGAVFLIIYGGKIVEGAQDVMLGNFLVFINAASFGLYLVLVKKLATKYNPIVFVKWLYLFGLLYVTPFSIKEALAINWETMPEVIYYKIGFVIIFTTCITYLFNLFALTKLKPTTVSVFIYLQPVVATLYAIFVGADTLNVIKIASAGLIFLGVYLVSKQAKKAAK
ncbi:threonine/homoserine efflux transporter RhtA [Lutibacter sp. Hel_I_33_5]|uniref:DMT family transporter n=1 Tax=Lutibacter sp. Hel_I_33_5 TaxID=1566289 RepID=UPI0011A0DA39|nr:DMT family transporter [Lutibacter sp. Hel_I_33_5]TVZ56266.1 threonine/homoserine efflux transporter RhtA [Lutibacter sp. Hel_I_33_5]